MIDRPTETSQSTGAGLFPKRNQDSPRRELDHHWVGKETGVHNLKPTDPLLFTPMFALTCQQLDLTMRKRRESSGSQGQEGHDYCPRTRQALRSGLLEPFHFLENLSGGTERSSKPKARSHPDASIFFPLSPKSNQAPTAFTSSAEHFSSLHTFHTSSSL